MMNLPRAARRAANSIVSRRRPRGLITALALCGVAIGVGATVRAEETKPWAGARVMVRTPDTALKVGPDVLATIHSGNVFHVAREQGNWLWVDSGNIRGWVKKTDVVRFEQAIEEFSRAIQAHPDDAAAYLNRGIARAARGDFDGAIKDYGQALKLSPRNAWAFHDRAVAYYARHDLDHALADADEAVSLDPTEPAHLANRASIRFAREEYDRALADYSEAIGRLDGDEASLDEPGDAGKAGRTLGRLWSVKWTCARAECWVAKRDFEQAIADYVRALRLDPKDFTTHNALAWLLATCDNSQVRDGRRALTLALRACDLTGFRNHLCLDTLAVAAAESGNFAVAIRWMNRALELIGDNPGVADDYRARLKLFQDHVPYHEDEAP